MTTVCGRVWNGKQCGSLSPNIKIATKNVNYGYEMHRAFGKVLVNRSENTMCVRCVTRACLCTTVHNTRRESTCMVRCSGSTCGYIRSSDETSSCPGPGGEWMNVQSRIPSRVGQHVITVGHGTTAREEKYHDNHFAITSGGKPERTAAPKIG